MFVPRVRSRGHTIMTLLQELRVSRGNPASEGSLGALFADFSTLALESHASYAFRKETRETEIRGRRGDRSPWDRGWIVWSLLSYILEPVFRFCPFPGTGY